MCEGNRRIPAHKVIIATASNLIKHMINTNSGPDHILSLHMTQWAVIGCQGGLALLDPLPLMYYTCLESLAKTGQNRCAIDTQLVLVYGLMPHLNDHFYALFLLTKIV